MLPPDPPPSADEHGKDSDRFTGAPSAASGRRVGPYEILAEVGRGGMGTVYKARHTRLGRFAAVKFLPAHLAADAQAKERFLGEARAAAALDHPNVCTIHDIGETEDGHLFLAMAFCEGETLKDRIARGPLPVEEAVGLARQIASGLSAAHARGIVHRDVKPANVIVTEAGAATVVDFGIAKVSGLDLTHDLTTLGTVAYMSPEQARGRDIDHRTDVWSLGVVLYEMLTGAQPFAASYDQAIVYRVLHEAPTPLASRRPDVPEAVARAVERALAKEPDERYPDLDAFVRGLAGLDAPSPASGTASTESAASGPEPTALPPATPHLRSSPTGTTSLSTDGERRQVTVVTSYLNGYSGLVEQLPPEAVDRVVAQIRRHADEVAERHGGLVNACDDDEIVLLFGVPTTHEDDAVRAARAARDLHARVREVGEEAGQPLRLGTGLDTGLVAAHRLGAGDAAYRITGRPAQAAGALSMHAEPDAVLATPESRRLVAAFFDTEAGTPVRLKGQRGPATPYRIGAETQGRVDATALTSYAGRANELEHVERLLDRAASGEGQFVAVVGEAGLGKSRFLHEVRRRLDAEATGLLQGRCQSHGAGTPYLPFIDALRDAFGLHDGAVPDPEAVAERVRAVSPDLDVFVPVYLHLLSIASEAHPLPKHLEEEGLRRTVEQALAALFTIRAADRPLVLVLEDWHWADDASGEALAQIVEIGAASRLLVLVTYRPGYGVEWSAHRAPTTIALRPLDAEASQVLLASVFGAEAFPEAAGRLLHERTGGNPFFLEEIAQALREEGTLRVEDGRVTATRPIDDAHLPNTVQAVLRTRLHRMPDEAQTVLRLASVVGREFTRGVLDHVLGDGAALDSALAALRSADLVQQTRVLPEAAYRFKHALTQEAAYDSLLAHQRKQLHGRVGAAIEAVAPDRLDEQADLLARHFSEAEAWDKAVAYGLVAARRASRLGQYADALQTYERVQRWLLRQPDRPARRDALVGVLLEQERLNERMGHRERQQVLIDEVRSLVEPGGTVDQRVTVLQRQGDLYSLLHHYAEAERPLREALRLRREIGDEEGERNVIRSLGMMCWRADRLGEAVEHIEAAIEIDRRRDDPKALLGDLNNLGHVLRSMGRFDEAIATLNESLDLAEDYGPKRLFALHALARIHHIRGDFESAKVLNLRAIEILKTDRLDFQRDNYFYLSMANILWDEGAYEESFRYCQEAVEGSRRTGDAEGLAIALQAISDRLLQTGRHEEALPHLKEAIAQFKRLLDARSEALAWSTVAVCHEKMDQHAESVEAWTGARTLFRQTDDGPGELKALEGMAQAARRLGGDAARAPFREALDLAHRLGDPEAEGRLYNAAGIAAWERSAFDDALPHFQAALSRFQDLGDEVHQALMFNSIGVTLRKLGRLDEAVVSLEEGAATARRAGQALLEGHALASLGEIAFDRERYDEARDHFAHSLDLRREANDRRGEGWMLVHLARTDAALGDTESAREHTAQALDVARTQGDADLEAACRRLDA